MSLFSHLPSNADARAEAARANVQGNDRIASGTLTARLAAKGTIRRGGRKGGNPGSNAFHAMQVSDGTDNSWMLGIE
jgi:hypothetical protein